MTIAVIGGGAAGLMAARTAAGHPGCRVVLLERQARVGRKLAATGNGRCNLTNENASPAAYHGTDAAFAAHALSVCGPAETLALFREMGLLTVTEPGGRVYPYSDQANSVVDVLRFAAESRGVELRTGCEVTGITREMDGFSVAYEGGALHADRVIVTCGGAAGTKLGGGTGGYRLLRQLGHSCTALSPSLVQLKTAGTVMRSLKGVRADAHATVLRRNIPVAEGTGEVQFTDYGLSGPVIFDLSRAALKAPDTVVSLDLLRLLDETELADLLMARAVASPQLTLENIFTGMIHNRLGRVVLRSAGNTAETPLGDLTRADAEVLARAAKDFRHEITGSMGFEGAQVTAGGVPTSEFDPNTLESRICPGLYAAGEILDIDGDCGGYNLQWAWSSGYVAGSSAAGCPVSDGSPTRAARGSAGG